MTATASNSYVAIARRNLDLEDYIDIARRNVSWIIGPLFAGLVISIVVAFLQPDIFISTAEMEIQPSQVSSIIVQSTFNEQLAERITEIEQDILSRTSLSSLIQDPKLKLYQSDLAHKPMEDVIEKMRNDISIKILGAVPTNGAVRASAFTISFQYPDRFQARDTVQQLVTKFEDADLTTQRRDQNVVSNLVQDELVAAKKNLDEVEEALTKFRTANSGSLPEQSELNMAQLGSLQQRSASLNDELNRIEQNRIQFQTHLQTLKSQLDLVNMFTKEGEYSPDGISDPNDRLVYLNKNIADIESQLEQLRQVYKDSYPDIRDADKKLGVLKKERDALKAERAKSDSSKKGTLRSAESLATLQGQIDQTNAELKSIDLERVNKEKEQAALTKQIAGYQERLGQTAALQAREQDLIRQEKTDSDKYQQLLAKENLAEQNGQLIQRRAGESLNMLDPPNLPTKADKPNRWEIVGIGMGISFILGLAIVGMREAKDASLKNLKDVRAYTNLPVLSSIPLLENALLVRRKRRIVYLAWSAAVIVGVIAITVSLYFYFYSHAGSGSA